MERVQLTVGEMVQWTGVLEESEQLLSEHYKRVAAKTVERYRLAKRLAGVRRSIKVLGEKLKVLLAEVYDG